MMVLVLWLQQQHWNIIHLTNFFNTENSTHDAMWWWWWLKNVKERQRGREMLFSSRKRNDGDAGVCALFVFLSHSHEMFEKILLLCLSSSCCCSSSVFVALKRTLFSAYKMHHHTQNISRKNLVLVCLNIMCCVAYVRKDFCDWVNTVLKDFFWWWWLLWRWWEDFYTKKVFKKNMSSL